MRAHSAPAPHSCRKEPSNMDATARVREQGALSTSNQIWCRGKIRGSILQLVSLRQNTRRKPSQHLRVALGAEDRGVIFVQSTQMQRQETHSNTAAYMHILTERPRSTCGCAGCRRRARHWHPAPETARFRSHQRRTASGTLHHRRTCCVSTNNANTSAWYGFPICLRLTPSGWACWTGAEPAVRSTSVFAGGPAMQRGLNEVSDDNKLGKSG